MSPDARLIALALISQDCGPEGAARRLGILETALPPADPQPGIRGMVPVAYVRDVLVGMIGRLEAIDGSGPLHREEYGEALNYAKRRLQDLETL